MKTLIPIDLSTIRQNPNYGKGIIYAEGRRRFFVSAVNPLPKKLERSFILTSYTEGGAEGIGTYEYEAIGPVDPGMVDALKKKGATLTIQASHREIDNSLAPEYYYGYLNITVECGNCHAFIPAEMIEREYGDEGGSYDTCPECGEIDTFSYEYERIEDALKRLPARYKIPVDEE